jgi:acyl-CoA reductase-like NAD-dependent aldehyde dehydrogenase
VLEKPISAELGNVSPWIVLPGKYSPRQFDYQAENVAASVINNAGCNCVATRVLVTWQGWSDRERFVDRVAELLESAAARDAWYPGARQRYREFTGLAADDPQLRATLVRNVDPESDSPFFGREPFTCVLAEVGLAAATPEEFSRRAIGFCNNTLWGTLAATLTVPASHRKGRAARDRLDQLVASLRFGMVGINQWVGLNYVLASPPWGGHPDSTPADVQSGNARVHNTFLLEGVDQVVMRGPLTSFPRPAWFPSHRNPEPLSWALLDLYDQPGWKSFWRLIRCI